MNNTARRHPRSTADAFPDERSRFIEGPYKKKRSKLLRAFIWACIGGIALTTFLNYI